MKKSKLRKMIPSQIQSELSIERTKMANRRTFLSYIRSSVALIVAGAGLLKFIQVPAWIGIGWICIVLAPILLVAGVIDYLKVRSLIEYEQEFMKSVMVNDDDDTD